MGLLLFIAFRLGCFILPKYIDLRFFVMTDYVGGKSQL